MMAKMRPSPASEGAEVDGGAKLWMLSAFLFGMFIVWSFLAPADATSVFAGAAQPQNLFCLVFTLCTAVSVGLSGRGIRFQAWQWLVSLLCLAWLITTAVLAGNENNPRTAWFGFWQCVSLAGFYICGLAILQGPRAKSMAVTLVMVGLITLAAQGMYQVVIGFPASRAQYEANPDEVLASGGLDAPAGSPLRKRFEDRLYSPEPYATFSLANSLAVVLSGGLVIALSLAIVSFRPGEGGLPRERLWLQVAALVALATIFATWFLTRSRTAYISVLIALLAWGCQALLASRLRRGKLPIKAMAIVTGISILVVAGGVWWLKQNDVLVISEAAKSLAFRLQYWQATAAMIREHWMWGVGLGNFQSYYPSYMLPTASETVADPHNWILDVAATLSLPIAVISIAWLVRLLSRSFRIDPESQVATAEEPQHKELDAGLARGMFFGAAVGSVLCSVLLWQLVGIDPTAVWLALLVGIPLGVALAPNVEQLVKRFPVALAVSAMAMVVCLLASGSWQASGIAVPLLTLLSCGSRKQLAMSESMGPSRWLVVVLPGMAVLCFVFQSWMPTTSSWVLIQQASQATSLNEQLRLARSAAEADQLDSENQRFVAQLLVADALNSPGGLFPKRSAEAVDLLDAWLAVDSVKAINWQFSGDRALELSAQSERLGLNSQVLVARACDYYAEASRRYPTSVQLQLQLSVAFALKGDLQSAKRELAQALELSEQTPHADKKVAAQQVWLPIAVEGLGNHPTNSAWMPAEPVAEWIRTL